MPLWELLLTKGSLLASRLVSFHGARKVLTAGAALLGLDACTIIQPIPTEVAVTVAPVVERFGLTGELHLAAGALLGLAMVNEKKVYCSATLLAYMPGMGGHGACFFDTTGTGYFDRWMMLGKLGSMTAGGLHIPDVVQNTFEFHQMAGPCLVAEHRIEARNEADRLECQMNAQRASASARSDQLSDVFAQFVNALLELSVFGFGV